MQHFPYTLSDWSEGCCRKNSPYLARFYQPDWADMLFFHYWWEHITIWIYVCFFQKQTNLRGLFFKNMRYVLFFHIYIFFYISFYIFFIKNMYYYYFCDTRGWGNTIYLRAMRTYILLFLYNNCVTFKRHATFEAWSLLLIQE